MIVVTGATGNVGLEVVQRLHQAGEPIRAAVTDPDRSRARLPEGIELARFDFTDPATYEVAFRGADRLFLVRPPAISEVKNAINPAVDAAVRAGVKRIVFLSLQGVEKNPIVPHYKIEKHLRTTGVATTMLRPSFFMQNLSTTHRVDIRDRDEIFVCAGGGRTAFIDARDVGAVGALALADRSDESNAYELTGREALTYDQVAAILSRVLDRPIRYARPGMIAFYRRMRSQEMPRAQVLVMIGLYTVARLGKAGTITAEMEPLLGRPPIGFEQFARDEAAAWQR